MLGITAQAIRSIGFPKATGGFRRETAKQMCRVYGADDKTRSLSVLQDRIWKILMRLQGLLHAISFLKQYRSEHDELAFPLWLDSAPRLLKRQLTMRITRRAPMGPRSASPRGSYAAN